jgi:hypothetical protein
MIDEEHGRRVLRRAFSEAGFQIEEDFPLQIAGTVILLDGYDPAQRVGYEYVTTEAGDRRNIDQRVLAELDRMNEQRLLHILLLDEQFIGTEEELADAVNGYLKGLSLGR